MSAPAGGIVLLPHVKQTPWRRSLYYGAFVLLVFGLVAFALAVARRPIASGWLGFLLVFGSIIVGALGMILPVYAGTEPGIKNNGVQRRGLTNRAVVGYLLAAGLIGLYICLYWFPQLLSGAYRLVDPLSYALRGQPAPWWFFYGFIYTLAVLVLGVRMFYRYRHSRYQLWRTASVMFFQLGFAFLIPHLMVFFKKPEFYGTYFWPLAPDALYPTRWAELTSKAGGLGYLIFFWGTVLSFVAVPVLTYFIGKRWYCSWVCGCGGLAETAGDPFRHLSSKKQSAWNFERWLIHAVLVVIVAGTLFLWIAGAAGMSFQPGSPASIFMMVYGFVVVKILAGVVGTGFYPTLGNRVWCRFACPLAAYLGLVQRFFSRFRITTNGGQCISCGQCSTYCEMGIDVRAYAQRGENIVRSSCVGCGICAEVCPRGVLKLETGPPADRFPGADQPWENFKAALKRRGDLQKYED